MFEDFWIHAQTNQSENMKVVTRFAGLQNPREEAMIEVQGTIEYSNLEGGFFYINATSFAEVKNVLLIGWDGVQRNHLFELLNKSSLPNLQSFINDGQSKRNRISHRTDTVRLDPDPDRIRWWRTGDNAYWFHLYQQDTIRRVESY
jgi:hypothetical protein